MWWDWPRASASTRRPPDHRRGVAYAEGGIGEAVIAALCEAGVPLAGVRRLAVDRVPRAGRRAARRLRHLGAAHRRRHRPTTADTITYESSVNPQLARKLGDGCRMRQMLMRPHCGFCGFLWFPALGFPGVLQAQIATRMVIATHAACRKEPNVSAVRVHTYKLGDLVDTTKVSKEEGTSWYFDQWRISGR